jgi:ATP-dependent DNA helicase RecG
MEEMELLETVNRLRRQRSDDATVEAKSAVGGVPKDVWATVSAFANTDGGDILLGLDERHGFEPAPGFDAQKTIDAVASGLIEKPGERPKVTPVPPNVVNRMTVDGAPVVNLRVDPMPEAPGPCFVTDQGISKGSYRRWDDKNVRLSAYEIYLLRHRTEMLGTDRQVVDGATVDDLDEGLVQGLITVLKRRGSRAVIGVESDHEVRVRLNLTDKQDRPLLAGVLSTGQYPQQFYPQLFIDVTAHSGVTKSDPKATARFADRRICEGAIPVMVKDAVAAVISNLRTVHVVEGVSGRDIPEIPEEVLREAVTNAVTHRDYSVQARGQQVSVDIYSDRVEVTSPGGFWGGVTAENISDGLSRSRNESLAKLLTMVPVPGENATVSENQGSGVLLMDSAMRARGLPAPQFEASIDQVRVVLARGVQTTGVVPELTEKQDDILAALRGQDEMTMRELARATGRTVAALRPQVRGLVEAGLVEATAPATSRNRAYRLPEGGKYDDRYSVTY